jgi:hypothetical protein
MLARMTEVAYRIFPAGFDYKVEIIRPGGITQTTLGFTSKEAAEAWVKQDQHIDSLDDSQRPSGPGPNMRVVE